MNSAKKNLRSILMLTSQKINLGKHLSYRHVIAACALVILSSPQISAQKELTPRKPLPNNIIRVPDTFDSPVFNYRLTVKFGDAWKVRVQDDGQIISSTGLDIDSTKTLIQKYQLQLEHLIKLPESTIERIVLRAENFSGNVQPDLMGMMIVHIPSARHDQIVKIGELLQSYSEVEYAYIETIGTPPPGDIGTPTPDYTSMQSYNEIDPGINMDYMYSLGITGTNVQITDCEYGFNASHEDLVDQNITMESGQTIPSWVAGNGWDDHGTACLGEMAAGDNGYGVTGLVYDVIVNFNPEFSDEEGGRRVTAIANGIDNSDEGDIILLEMQTQASYISGNAMYGPAELDPNVWTITKTATDAGVIVVAAAGNGNLDLDSSDYSTYSDYGDSGAVIVGAGSSDVLHDKMYFSTYGARVNIQGWGENVFTTGYGYYSAIDNDVNQEYTNSFNGTSSASPIVASALAAIQDYVLSNGNEPLSPENIRQLIMDTGIAQGTGGNIGVFPDLANAIATLVDGCMDALACNYDPNANLDDASCILPDGCTNALACNYDLTAQCDDGSCTYLDNPVTDLTAYNWTLVFDSGCTGSGSSEELTFDADQTFLSSASYAGMWSLCG
ncbi:MAG: S8 family serine peptidase, partial [Flavobacteriales bacterium]